MVIYKEKIKELENFFKENKEIRSGLNISYKNLEREVIGKINSYKSHFNYIPYLNKKNTYKINLLFNQNHYSNYEKIQIIKELTKENINKNDKEILINEFYFYIKDFLEKFLEFNDIRSIIIILFRIYEFFPKNTEFIRREIPNILASLLKKTNTTLNESIKNNISNIINLLNNRFLSDKSQFIIRNNSNNLENDILNMIRSLSNNESIPLSDESHSNIRNMFLNIIKNLLNNDNFYEKIKSIKLILENKDIFSKFIKTELLNIIKSFLDDNFFNGFKLELLKLVLENRDIFSKFIGTELINIIKSLLNDDYFNGFKLELLKLVLENRDIFSKFIKTELPNIIKSLLNNNYFIGSKLKLLKLVLENRDIFSKFIKIELPNVINDLSKKYLNNNDKLKLLELKSEIEKIIESLEIREMETLSELEIKEGEIKN